jgi:hypothetical protein
VVDQEASLTVGLGKLAANRNRVGLCGLLRLCVFSLSSTLAHNSASGHLRFSCSLLLNAVRGSTIPALGQYR